MKNEQSNFSREINSKRVIFAVISAILTGSLVGVGLLTKQFIDKAVTFNTSYIQSRFVILLCAYALIAVVFYYKKYLELYLEKLGNYAGKVDLSRRVLDKDIRFFHESKTGELVYNINNDVQEIMPWQVVGKLQFWMEWLNVVVIMAFMIYIDLKLSAFSFLLIGASIFFSKKMSEVIAKRVNEKQKISAKLNQYMVETIKSLGTIIMLNKTGYFGKKHHDYMENELKPVVDKIVIAHALFISQLILSQETIPVLTLLAGMFFTLTGNLTIGSALIMMSFTVQISKSVQSIGELLPKKNIAKEVKDRIHMLYEADPKRSDGTLVPDFQRMDVEIKEFVLYEKEQPTLRDIAFTVNKGELVLIKGESGTGKTTLVNLISRLITAEGLQGNILYNGSDIKSFSLNDYYHHVLQVEQDTILIEGTLEQNITLGDRFEKEDVDEIIAACMLEDFVRQKGISHEIKQSGANISGGERHRIGLARMLLRRPELLILDEPTRALNREMRVEMLQRIMKYKERHQLSIIAISHNEDLDMYADKTLDI